MRVQVRAAKGLRVPLPGRQYIGADPVEIERTPFVESLIAGGDLVEVDPDTGRRAKPDAAPVAPVKEG